MTIAAHPLQWPAGWKRTAPTARKSGKFNRKDYGHRGTRALSITEGTQRVLQELERMGRSRDDVVISSNVQLRLDGLPRSDRAEPTDPGVAVYWSAGKHKPRVIAIDLYDRVADNLGAVAATLEAMRAIERHGGAVVLERAFTGFTALPSPTAEREWWQVLGVERAATADEIRAAYRRLASQHHPDRGGDAAVMAAINVAQDQGLKERAA